MRRWAGQATAPPLDSRLTFAILPPILRLAPLRPETREAACTPRSQTGPMDRLFWIACSWEIIFLDLPPFSTGFHWFPLKNNARTTVPVKLPASVFLFCNYCYVQSIQYPKWFLNQILSLRYYNKHPTKSGKNVLLQSSQASHVNLTDCTIVLALIVNWKTIRSFQAAQIIFHVNISHLEFIYKIDYTL